MTLINLTWMGEAKSLNQRLSNFFSRTSFVVTVADTRASPIQKNRTTVFQQYVAVILAPTLRTFHGPQFENPLGLKR